MQDARKDETKEQVRAHTMEKIDRGCKHADQRLAERHHRWSLSFGALTELLIHHQQTVCIVADKFEFFKNARD